MTVRMWNSTFKLKPRPAREAKQTTSSAMPKPIAQPLRMADTRARLTVAIPKRKPIRSKALREAYRLIPCQFDRDEGGLCAVMDGTVCCCHSNWSIHGKAGALKADDNRAASGCFVHHGMLDQGSKWSEAERKQRWWAAHCRSVALLVQLGHWPDGAPVPDTSINPF